jgi:hypothetical protein
MKEAALPPPHNHKDFDLELNFHQGLATQTNSSRLVKPPNDQI